MDIYKFSIEFWTCVDDPALLGAFVDGTGWFAGRPHLVHATRLGLEVAGGHHQGIKKTCQRPFLAPLTRLCLGSVAIQGNDFIGVVSWYFPWWLQSL